MNKTPDLTPSETAVVSQLIRRPFEIEVAPDQVDSEDELLRVLTLRITEMLERQPEQLMSLLYRLDVEESKINRVMHPSAPEMPALGLARLVLERQKQRVHTRRSVNVQPLEDLADWNL